MQEIEFSISLLFFWIKGGISVDNRFIKTNFSNTILGIFPAGKEQQNIPLKNVSGANLNTKYSIKRILVGLVVAMVGFNMLGESFMAGLIVFAAGVITFLSSIETVLTIEKSGSALKVYVPFFENKKMTQFSDYINNGLTYVADQDDLNRFFDEKANVQK